jgi:hypothetical protein
MVNTLRESTMSLYNLHSLGALVLNNKTEEAFHIYIYIYIFACPHKRRLSAGFRDAGNNNSKR